PYVLSSSIPNQHQHSFPTRRSSDLNSALASGLATIIERRDGKRYRFSLRWKGIVAERVREMAGPCLASYTCESKLGCALCDQAIDRKSTRLNSSHVSISYAVFCLKK